MSRLIRITLIFVILAGALSTAPAKAQAPTSEEICIGKGGNYVLLTSGEEYCIFVPPVWNGDLVVFAHGYVDPRQPLQIPWDQLILQDGTTSIPSLIVSMHFAFAVTSYHKVGLAVKEGVADVLDLVNFVKDYAVAQLKRQVNHVYVVGVSEGGLVTTLAVEQNPNVFSGGMAACGPIGDFTKQVNYWGDFRVVFDYLFPGVLKPTAVNIPASYLIPGYWEGVLVPSIAATLGNPANSQKDSQLLRVTNAPIDPANPATIIDTAVGILSYNVLATDEARQELYGPEPVNLESNQGQPFDNRYRFYFGSANDWLLNAKVARYSADATALGSIKSSYQTSGVLKVPLIAIHDTGDPIVPYWHETLYRLKTLIRGSFMNFINIPISRYGHCQFTATEALAAFYLMVIKSSIHSLLLSDVLPELPPEVDQQQFEQIIEQYSTPPIYQVFLPIVQ